MNAEFGKYLSMLKTHFYKAAREAVQKEERPENGGPAAEAETVPSREDAV